MKKRVLKEDPSSNFHNTWISCQQRKRHFHKGLRRCVDAFCLSIAVLLIMILVSESSWAQTEVTQKSYRYSERELTGRSYESHEVRPRTYPVFVRGGIPQKEAVTLSPIAEKVRRRQYLADSHWGLKFYERLTCARCHPQQVRASATGRSPLPGLNTTIQR
jgi:hypothetical protein